MRPNTFSPKTDWLTLRNIFLAWWPLVASGLLMAVQLQTISAVLARLPQPEIHLAAYGGIVFPLSLLVEAPIVMLLAASTELSRDYDSYKKLRLYMMLAGLGLTIVHVSLAFTPLYDLVVVTLMGAPAEIVEPARLGMMILTPRTWAIAYRRFNQGVLIRHGSSSVVARGTLIRLLVGASVLAGGYLVENLPGIVVAATAVSASLILEGFYNGYHARPLARNLRRTAHPAAELLTFRKFSSFYLPLATSTVLVLLMQVLGAAALNRMGAPLVSLAVWPVVSAALFFFRSFSIPYSEVVVALLDRPAGHRQLRRFTLLLSGGTSLLLLLVAATPLAELWFGGVSGLSRPLAAVAQRAIWLTLPIPGLTALHSWFQGRLVSGRRTRGVIEAIVAFMLSNILVLAIGLKLKESVGLYFALAGIGVGGLVQAVWLGLRSRTLSDRAAAPR